LANVALVFLLVGLAAFNAWWYWRDSQPLTDPRTISTWIRGGLVDAAEAALRERLRRAPNDGDARMNLARILGTRNDLAGCAAELHRVPHWWPTKPEARYREGSVYLMLDRARDAETAWVAVVKDDPLHPVPSDIFHDASFELLKLYATEDRWEDAFVVLWRAYDEASLADRPTLLTWRLRSELERVAPLEAIPRLRAFVAAAPDDYEARRAQARAEQALGQSDEARRQFEACLKLRPEDPRVLRDYLATLHELGDWQAFDALLSRVPKAADTEPEIWKFRGMAKEKAGDLEGASLDYRAAIERNPNIVEYHHRLAMAAERLGRRDEADEHRKTAAKLRGARARLSKAFADYLDARSHRDRGGPDLKMSMENLAAICDTLGFARAAEGWTELADAQ
jgi:Tfp pilus assembly protein PilF